MQDGKCSAMARAPASSAHHADIIFPLSNGSTALTFFHFLDATTHSNSFQHFHNKSGSESTVMHKINVFKGALPAAARLAARPLSTTSSKSGILSNDKNDPIDPSKEPSDTIAQAKNEEGSTPAHQHARATGHPVNESSGNPKPSPSKPGKDSPGLGSNHAEQGKKPGEEAVNPAVEKQ